MRSLTCLKCIEIVNPTITTIFCIILNLIPSYQAYLFATAAGGEECACAQSSGVSYFKAWARRGTSGVILSIFKNLIPSYQADLLATEGRGGGCACAQSSGVSSYNAWVRRGTSGVILAEFR